MHNWASFFIGGLTFTVILLIIVWLTYSTRTFVFSACPTDIPICRGANYYNDPGEAIANGSNVNDILFIDSNNEMFYKRVRRTNNCIPGFNQTIPIMFPQYCSFTDVFGATSTWKETYFNSNIYRSTNGLSVPVTTT